MVVQEKDPDDPSHLDLVSFPHYQVSDVQPPFPGEDDFWLQSQCMIHLVEGVGDEPLATEGTDSICLFLYEVCSNPCCVNRVRGD